MATVKTLLMVDDDEDLLNLLKRKLEKSGSYRVITTTRGNEAVGLARQESPDLVVLDIDMPDMDGGEVSKALAADNDTRQIPVLFLSGIVTKEDIHASGGIIGGSNMASKKGTIVELIERIESLVA
jgi:CheY-like chemotaxis protein